MTHYNTVRELRILGCMMNTASGDYCIWKLEDFIAGQGEFESLSGIPEHYLLDILKESLLDNKFVDVTLKYEGVRQRCLQWVEEKREKHLHKVREERTTSDENVNPYPQIFTLEGWRLFVDFEANKTEEDSVIKYFSAIWDYLNDRDMLTSSEKKYRDFIKEKYKVKEKFSRIDKRDPSYPSLAIAKRLSEVHSNLKIREQERLSQK